MTTNKEMSPINNPEANENPAAYIVEAHRAFGGQRGEDLNADLNLTPREKLWVENFGEHQTPASLKLSRDYLREIRGSVLEIGCAWGRVLKFLKRYKSIDATGVDINKREIAVARRENLKASYMNGRELRCADNSYDHVVMVGALSGEEPEVRREMIKEAVRVVKPGGTVGIVEFRRRTELEDVQKYEEAEKVTHEQGTRIIIKRDSNGEPVLKDGKPWILFIAKHFTEDELIDLLRDAGLERRQTRGETIVSPGVGDHQRKERMQITVWGTKPKPSTS